MDAQVNDYGMKLWANYTISTKARSDNDLAKICGCTSQTIGGYRRGSHQPSEKFVEENNIKITLAKFPRGLRGGGHIYQALRDYCINNMYNNTSMRDVEDFISELDNAIGYDSKFFESLSHLKATTYIISNYLDVKLFCYKKAQGIHKDIQNKSSDPYWINLSKSQSIFIDFHIMKYFGGDVAELSKEDALSLTKRNKKPALYLNDLTLWINHMEFSSVAENSEELYLADEKITQIITGNGSTTPARASYLALAVMKVLELRDGFGFRNKHKLSIGELL